MTVHVTELSDLGFEWRLFGRVASDVATGGAAELAWNKKARGAIITGAKAIGKGAAKVTETVMCPIAKQFSDKKVAEASAKTGYGIMANVAAQSVNSLCQKGKKPAVAPVVAIAPPRWWHNPWRVGAIAVGTGVLLGALFGRR